MPVYSISFWLFFLILMVAQALPSSQVPASNGTNFAVEDVAILMDSNDASDELNGDVAVHAGVDKNILRNDSSLIFNSIPLPDSFENSSPTTESNLQDGTFLTGLEGTNSTGFEDGTDPVGLEDGTDSNQINDGSNSTEDGIELTEVVFGAISTELEVGNINSTQLEVLTNLTEVVDVSKRDVNNDEQNSVESEGVKFVDVPVENKTISCNRGERQEEDECVVNKFSLGGNNIIRPECLADMQCPMNAICDDEKLCACIYGDPLEEENCEPSSLGQECNGNLECKSWTFECQDGICKCKSGRYEIGSSCKKMPSLDEPCNSNSIPCHDENVKCLTSMQESCHENSTCTCQCETGYSKVNKYCVLSGEAKHDQQEREEFTAEPDFEPTLADEETIASESPNSTQHVLESTSSGNFGSQFLLSNLTCIVAILLPVMILI